MPPRLTTLDDLQHLHGAWSQAASPRQTPAGLVARLREAVEALAGGHDPEEAASCLLLRLGHAHARGSSLWDAAVATCAAESARAAGGAGWPRLPVVPGERGAAGARPVDAAASGAYAVATASGGR
jgi:hypothetical protein